MNQLFKSIRSFAIEEDGAQIIEYALIIAVVSLALIAAMDVTSIGFDTWVSNVSTCLTTGVCP